nr:hypothetical protein [Tanacetum cinerariifolium]
PPPPPPPAGASGAPSTSRASGSSQLPPPPPLPSTDVENNWATALVLAYETPAKNPLLAKTRDMTNFLNWYCRQVEECHKMLTDHVDRTNLEGDQVRVDVNRPLPLGGPLGYEFKHDYTIIESPRAVVFPVNNNEQKIMRIGEGSGGVVRSRGDGGLKVGGKSRSMRHEPVAPPSLEYVPGPEHPPVPIEDHPYAVSDSPIALSPSYVADSDPEEDSEDGPVDYPADEGDDDDEPSDDDDDDDEDDDEEPFEDEDDDEEEEHLAPADSSVIRVVDHVPLVEDTEALETGEPAPTPVPSPRRHTARMSVRPQTAIPFPSGAEVERLLALPTPPLSPLTPLSSPLPPLPASLSIPPPVDRREDTPEAELPPRKRLCLTTPTSRYEVGKSSTDAPRPTGGHRSEHGFIDTIDAEIRRQRAEGVGYGIKNVWVDPIEAIEEVAPMTLEGVNTRVTELAEV